MPWFAWFLVGGLVGLMVGGFLGMLFVAILVDSKARDHATRRSAVVIDLTGQKRRNRDGNP